LHIPASPKQAVDLTRLLHCPTMSANKHSLYTDCFQHKTRAATYLNHCCKTNALMNTLKN